MKMAAIKSSVALIGMIIGFYMGPLDVTIWLLLAAVTADYISGVVAAICTKTLDSNVGYKGLLRKILIFIVVGAGHVVDELMTPGESLIRTALIAYYLANEGISILENTARAGLPVPDRIRRALEQLQDDNK